jgi:outer membrane immunogenic protein
LIRITVGYAAGALLVTIGPAAAQVTPYDWTGFYAGASAGVVRSDTGIAFGYPDATDAPDTVYFNDAGVPVFSSYPSGADGAVPFPDVATFDGPPALATLGIGYDIQNGDLVFGLATDISWLHDGLSSWTTGEVSEAGRTQEVSVWGGLDRLASVRGRAGLSIDRLLLFGTAGLAAGHIDLATNASDKQDNGYGTAEWAGSHSGWEMGYVLGAGAEYAVTDNLSLKIEGLHYGLGRMTVTTTGEGTYGSAPLDAVAPYEVSADLGTNVLQVGLNLRF